jgi:hypothetical protein
MSEMNSGYSNMQRTEEPAQNRKRKRKEKKKTIR